MKKLLIFASGSGSNAENIIRYFRQRQPASVQAVFTNKADAGVVAKAEAFGIPSVVFSKDELNDGSVLKKVEQFSPDLIVLAGFLLKFPSDIIEAFPHKVINIHPALLPKFGGKGMYGMNVHKAVLEQSETETGITIHYIDEHYDEGATIFQASVPVTDCVSAEEIALKVLALEHEHFPKIIEKILSE